MGYLCIKRELLLTKEYFLACVCSVGENTKFTHQRLFTSVGAHDCICERIAQSLFLRLQRELCEISGWERRGRSQFWSHVTACSYMANTNRKADERLIKQRLCIWLGVLCQPSVRGRFCYSTTNHKHIRFRKTSLKFDPANNKPGYIELVICQTAPLV